MIQVNLGLTKTNKQNNNENGRQNTIMQSPQMLQLINRRQEGKTKERNGDGAMWQDGAGPGQAQVTAVGIFHTTVPTNNAVRLFGDI